MGTGRFMDRCEEKLREHKESSEKLLHALLMTQISKED
jgi:hypothetical protein